MSMSNSDLLRFQKISSSLTLRNKNINDISTTLNCSNCSKGLRPPLVQCVQNHLLCGKCSKWECAKKCAKCDDDLALSVSRMLGKIIKRIPLMCKYEYCKIVSNWEDIKNHEKDCEHKDVLCIVERKECQWRGHPSNVINHIRKKHINESDSTDNGIIVNMPFDKTKVVFRIIDAFDKTFLVYLIHCLEKKSTKIYVQALNDDSDKGAKFMVDVIHLTSKHSTYTTTGSCKVNGYNKYTLDYIHHVNMPDHSSKSKSSAAFKISLRYKIFNPVTPEILESMKCPVCDKVMLGHIFQCSLGHSFCKSCVGKFQNCAICRASIERLRNYSLENLIEKMYAACKFSKYGCLEMGGIEYIADHELKCSFQSRLCCICNINIDIDKYEEHSRLSHISESTIDMRLRNAILTSKIKKFITTYRNIQFNVYLTIDLENQLLCYMAQSTESREHAKNYIYSLIIGDKKINKREIRFTETCTSHLDSLSSVITSGRYIAIPLDIVATYLDDEGTLTYTMSLESASRPNSTAAQPQEEPSQAAQQPQEPQAQEQEQEPEEQQPQEDEPQPQEQQPQEQPPQEDEPQPEEQQPEEQQPQEQPQQAQPQPQAQQPQAQPQPQAQQPQAQPQPQAQQPQAQPQPQPPQAQPQRPAQPQQQQQRRQPQAQS